MDSVLFAQAGGIGSLTLDQSPQSKSVARSARFFFDRLSQFLKEAADETESYLRPNGARWVSRLPGARCRQRPKPPARERASFNANWRFQKDDPAGAEG